MTAERDEARGRLAQALTTEAVAARDLREAERNAADAGVDQTIAEEVASALCLAARAAEMLALVCGAARREGAEEMRKRARQRTEVAAVDAGVVDNTVTRRWLLCLAREIDALPLDAPGGAT